ncbi:hypothetical protein [uncultured Luteimonas sp.]|nr:hypothetical protein [uncultured Luteimonas sp.]
MASLLHHIQATSAQAGRFHRTRRRHWRAVLIVALPLATTAALIALRAA